MRLIDADKLIEYIKKWSWMFISESDVGLSLCLVKDQPTAFDVGKVVDKINSIEYEREEYSEMPRCNMDEARGCSSSCFECIMSYVVGIVEDGVISETD